MKASVPIVRGIESLFGTRDENIRLFESGLKVSTQLINDSLEIEGEPANVARAENILEDYVALVREGHIFNNGDLNSYLRVCTEDPEVSLRGRTLNESFIILDEAQNSTPEQMKMVLTRQGFGSKMVVNGDVTQIDLPPGRRSGLLDALDVLRGVDGISFVNFDERDVVRHNLVQRIVRAYEKYNEMVGAGRQLTLRLAENAPEATAEAAASPEAQPSKGA